MDDESGQEPGAPCTPFGPPPPAGAPPPRATLKTWLAAGVAAVVFGLGSFVGIQVVANHSHATSTPASGPGGGFPAGGPGGFPGGGFGGPPPAP